MKHVKFFALLLLIPLICGCSAVKLAHLFVPAPSLGDPLLGESSVQPIAVLLPYGYDANGAPYPTVYFLPGFGADHAQVARLAADALNRQPKDAPPMIVVVVNGTNKLGGCFYVNSPVTGNWADYIANDVIPYVDAHFNTDPSPTARGIAGHSMGGFGAIHLALTQPDLFSHVYSMSPGLFGDNGFENSGIDFDLLQSSAGKYADLPTYLRAVSRMNWPDNFAHAYASAFAPDPLAPLPHFALPDTEGDEIYRCYQKGFGGWEEKLAEHGDSLRGLVSFAVEYGESDALAWIPDGCRHLCALLGEAGIAHQQLPFDGGHTDKLPQRLANHMLPFFQAAFAD